MRFTDLRGIVAPTVVALRKDINLIDMPQPEPFLPLLFVKPSADSWDKFGSVKVEVDLTVR
jgi:hypothetical protein